MMLPRIARTVSLALVLVASTASADDADDWVERGIQLRRAHNDAEALELFRRAYEVRPTPRTRVQIALAEQAMGQWLDAESDLEAALKIENDPWIDRNRAKLSEGLETIRDHLAWLRVDSQAGAELWINGARVGPLPHETLRVIAAAVQIELRASEFEPWAQSVDAKPRETLHIVARLARIRRAALAPSAALGAETETVRTRAAMASTRRTMGWLGVGVGGLLLIEAASAQLIREQAISHYNDDSLCLRPGLSRENTCGAYRGRAEIAQVFATVGWIAGGVVASTGVFLLLTTPREPSRSLSVSWTPNETSLSWRQTF